MQTSILSRKQFYEELSNLPREDLVEIINEQNPNLMGHVERIEYVFKHKLTHLTWSDGTPIEGRPVTNYELALLVDPPFQVDPELTSMGLTSEEQYSVHIASDPVMWSRSYLNASPRAYQIWMMRHPNTRKVLRAGRRLGKSWTMAVIMLWWAFTRNKNKILVMAPMKSHVELLYKAVVEMVTDKNAIPAVQESITRKVTAPQYKIEFSNGSQISFFTTGMKSGGKCLTPDHDILTRDGWKPVADVEENETILAWDGDKYLWSDVSESHEYDFDGELVAHSGKQVSFRVTPNHKFATKTRAPGSEWRDTYAEDLKDYYIPTGANPVMRPNWTYSNAELELWGWWLAEGSGFIGKMARISQVKEHGRRRIVELAETLGLHYTTPQKEIRVQWTPPIFSGTNAYNKFIPRDLFDECNIGALLDGLLGGDGWMREKGWEYSSSSRQLAEDVQELGVRIGLRANLREKNISYRPVGGGLPNRHWIVSGYDYKQSVLDKDNLHREPYSGKVHCVTVPDVGYFVTRHNGLVHVTGNSDVARGQEAHLIILDELDYMGPDDLDAIYVMLQDTDLEIGEEKSEEYQKVLIGASTPTGLRGKFWDWCFPAGTNISLADSFKPIEEIEPGDEVLNQFGELEPVVRLYQREYDGPTTSIKLNGHYPLTATSEHPHIIKRNDQELVVAASDVHEGDFMKVPFRAARDESELQKKLSEYIEPSAECRVIERLREAGVCFVDIDKILNRSKGFSAKKYAKFKHNGYWVDPRRVRTKEAAAIHYEFVKKQSNLKALGLFLAEGSVLFEDGCARRSVWTFNSQESDLVQEVVDFMANLGLTVKVVDKTDIDNSVDVISYCAPFAVLMDAMIGRKTQKRVPSFLDSASIEQQNSFIDGVLAGDAHFITPMRWALGLSAREAIIDLYQIMLKRGEFVSLGRQDRADRRPVFLLSNRMNRADIEWSLDGVWLKVIGTEDGVYKGKVYNFETRDTHTYVAESMATHNCHDERFTEFWFPSLVNPGFKKSTEDDFRAEYDEMAYRHEVEADWGESAEGVYPRRYVDAAFLSGKEVAEPDDDIFRVKELSDWDWNKNPVWLSTQSKFVMGVDWDKFGAGPNICVLEIVPADHEDKRFAGRARIAFREEIKRSEFVLIEAVERIKFLNGIFKPEWIYVDRGYGEVQVELLHQAGIENPGTGLRHKVKGIAFGGSVEMRDPATKQLVKKEAKPFMVENLRWMLEREMLALPSSDDVLWEQLAHYIVMSVSVYGLPRFQMADPKMPDHAHDALLLACLAYKQNYDELMKKKISRMAIAVPNAGFMPLAETDPSRDEDQESPRTRRTRSMSAKLGGRSRTIKRQMF